MPCEELALTNEEALELPLTIASGGRTWNLDPDLIFALVCAEVDAAVLTKLELDKLADAGILIVGADLAAGMLTAAGPRALGRPGAEVWSLVRE
jgi:hypothetical protein